MIDESKARVPELDQYVDLMRMRALGEAPEMDSAKQMARVLRDHLPKGQPRYSFMDVGCATGHYLRSIRNAFGASSVDYIGIDVDTKMVAAARAAWSTGGDGNAKPRFVRAGVEDLGNENWSALELSPVDAVFCSNAFMYFSRPQQALANMMSLAHRLMVIRSYFCEITVKALRAQPREYHADSPVGEADILDDRGYPKFYDEWNFYSYSYMEALVKKIDPNATPSWIEDDGASASIEQEAKQGIVKRGATQVVHGLQIMTPFIQTWRYLLIRL